MANDNFQHPQSEALPAMGSQRLRFKDLTLGFSSADFEASHDPALLLSGFIDPLGLVQEAIHGRKFLFLGYKGSGKSALGEHLRLLADGDANLFVHFADIGDVSFSTFSQILKEKMEPEARYPTVWSWLLLVFLLDSFRRDLGSNCSDDEELYVAFETLKDLGMLPTTELKQAVSVTAEQGFSLKLSAKAGVFGGGIEAAFKTSKVTSDLPFVVDRLRIICRRFASQSKHLLIIDGFDELLRRGKLQYDALGTLVYEVNRLNMDFAASRSPAKIILLCRTDLFERLPGANKNKVRQNAALHLNWANASHDPRDSALVKLINHRANMGRSSEIDVFSTFLPPMIGKGKAEIRSQLLDQTRLLPRDMVMLLHYLQKYSGDEQMTPNQVFDALHAYSQEYFLPEIIDNLDGLIAREDTQKVFKVLGSAKKISLSLKEFEQQSRMLMLTPGLDIDRALAELYECSAIGNMLYPDSNRITFKYRSIHTTFNPGQRIYIHPALWRPLDLRW